MHIYHFYDTMLDRGLYVQASNRGNALRRIKRSRYKRNWKRWLFTGSSESHDFDVSVIGRVQLVGK